jgi:NAD(P)-dependent dehydrogenase (short-subunit alcohol dehydrogenase family)
MPVAIITGASRGFGRALGADLARDGWSLVVDARRDSELLGARETFIALGARVEALSGDVTDPDHRARLIDAALGFGSLDLLVNNASTLGTSPLPTLDRYPLDELLHVFDVNVVAPLALIQLALPLLRQSRGAVVSLSSDAAVEAYEGWGGYGSSKAALDQLHRVLAIELGDVRLYSFDPGDMRTEMHQAAFPGEDISDRPDPSTVVPALRSLLASAAPSGRFRASDWASA